jgi:hypothetical protein
MQAVLARITWTSLPPLQEVLRASLVCGCALALILAGPVLPVAG